MSYLALYRKFRPKSFDEVVGQDHISTTLRNQITQGRISHAYLFCGSRGTGKTSLAKLFAKAVNCENNQNGNPCEKCNSCKALSSPDNMDIVEIDAASNNSVDDLRDLRDKVQFQPVSCKYKAYIIDEVHMLTINAFNALLKTLEEPPAHVIFILATTEAHKIPSTILSRCMRFDFKLIPLNDIFSHLKFVYSQVGKEAEDEALYAIAKAGDGSMRDALSIAEICLSLSDGKLTFDQVNDIVGNLSREKLEKLFEAISTNDTNTLLNLVDEYFKSGKSVQVISRDIFSFMRDMLVLKIANADTLNLPKDAITRMQILAKNVDNAFLIRALDILSELEPKFKWSQNPKILLETSLLKMTSVQNDLSVNALARRVIALENKIKNLSLQTPSNEPKTHSQFDNANSVEFDNTNSSTHSHNDNAKNSQTSDLRFQHAEDSVNQDVQNSHSSENYQQEKNFNASSSKTINSQQYEAEISQVQDSAVSSQNIGGRLLTQLRKNFDPALIALVGVSTVTASGDCVTISTKTQSSLSYLSSTEIKAQLQEAIAELGFATLSFSLVEPKIDPHAKIIQNAKDLVGDLLEIKTGD